MRHQCANNESQSGWLSSKKSKLKVFMPIIGFLSLAWFLLRVIPKPSRAMYPCQRLALPMASGFALWLVSLFSSVVTFKKVIKLIISGRFACAMLAFLCLGGALGFTLLQMPAPPALAQDAPFEPIDAPNSPMGRARGLFPGRVVWAHQPDATSWDGAGYWSDDRYTNQVVIDEMLSQSLRDLTGTTSDAAAWEALFRHFNRTHDYGDVGYESGEKIAIKLNLNACNTHGTARNSYYSSPHGALAILQQLVESAGVNASDITFYDATRFIPKEIFDKCIAAYPAVVFADWEGGDGRVRVRPDVTAQIKFSQPLTLEPEGGNPTYVPTCVSQAKYLINMGQLKGHNLAGITLNGKNLFGAIISYPPNNIPQSSAPKNAGLHPYVCVHSDFHFGGHWDFDKRDMGTYNAIVDLMGYVHLGAKTMLYFIDGLYSAPDQSTELRRDHRWQSFANDWPNSIFVSQDVVAIESVCLDFLRNEPGQTWVRGNVDNYLHEAALADDAPSGTIYDPEQDGTALSSLGVHEHWNNAADKKYSRNLGTADGIDFVRAGSHTSVREEAEKSPDMTTLIKNFPNPFNPTTTISYTLPSRGQVSLSIYSATGARIAELVDEFQEAGTFHLVWDGDRTDRLPSGFYFVHLVTEEERVTHRMILLR